MPHLLCAEQVPLQLVHSVPQVQLLAQVLAMQVFGHPELVLLPDAQTPWPAHALHAFQ